MSNKTQKPQLNIPVVMHWVSVVYELPPKNEIVIGYFPRGAKRGQKATPKSITQKESSKTFTGVAKAMAEQWSVVLTACT